MRLVHPREEWEDSPQGLLRRRLAAFLPDLGRLALDCICHPGRIGREVVAPFPIVETAAGREVRNRAQRCRLLRVSGRGEMPETQSRFSFGEWRSSQFHSTD